MSSNLITTFDTIAESAAVPAGTVLFRCGDPVFRVYLVRKGRVVLVWPDSKNLQPMEVLGPGNLIGLPAALNGDYSVTARALEDCDLGVLPASRVVELLEGDPRMMQSAIRLLGQEVARMRRLFNHTAEPDHS